MQVANTTTMESKTVTGISAGVPLVTITILITTTANRITTGILNFYVGPK